MSVRELLVLRCPACGTGNSALKDGRIREYPKCGGCGEVLVYDSRGWDWAELTCRWLLARDCFSEAVCRELEAQ